MHCEVKSITQLAVVGVAIMHLHGQEELKEEQEQAVRQKVGLCGSA
jgi:hypothetical protein